MDTTEKLLVATFSRPTALLVERATRNHIATEVVDPTVESLSAALASAPGGVVVLDALQQEAKAIECARAVLAKKRGARIVVLANRPDSAVVAKAAAAGAWDFAMPYTPTDELLAMLLGAIHGQPASAESVFGKIRSVIPVGRNSAGDCMLPTGEAVSIGEAVVGCEALGLTAEEVASVVGVPTDTLEDIKKAYRRRTRRGGFVTDALAAIERLLGRGDSSSGRDTTDDRPNVRPALVACAVAAAVAVGIGWSLSTRATRMYGVRGTVQYQGEPIVSGEIDFLPSAGGGKARSAAIQNGSFDLPSRDGLPRGQEVTVRVYGYRKVSKTYETNQGEVTLDVQEQVIPPQYNRSSDLRFQTTSENLRRGLVLDLK